MAATRKTAQATLEPASRKKATDKPLAGKPAAGSADAPANGAAGTIRRRNVEKILKAAESVFAKKGFAGASTAEIARKAGVPKANLHYYFRTKQDLYASVLDALLEVWTDE